MRELKNTHVALVTENRSVIQHAPATMARPLWKSIVLFEV
jgi:hypothetical protein